MVTELRLCDRYKERTRQRVLLSTAVQRITKNSLCCAFYEWKHKVQYKQEVRVKVRSSITS